MHDVLVRNRGVDLAVRSWGRPDARPVVLVHGHGTNLLSWSLVAAELENSHTVVAYDRRGHGRSTSSANCSIEDLASDLEAVVAHLGLLRPTLVGHSVGSWDALTYAASRSTVASVVCLDQAIATEDPVWHRYYRPSAREARRAELSKDLLLTRGFTAAEIDGIETETRSQGHLHPWDVWGPMLRRNVTRHRDGTYWFRPYLEDRLMLELGWASVLDEPYGDISCPVTIVLARKNPGPMHDMFHRLVVRRNLRAVSLDSDHDIHIERPADVAELVRDTG